MTARETGYKHPQVRGSQILREPAVAAAIKEAMESRAMAACEVVARLAEQAWASMEEFIDLDVEVEVTGEEGKTRTVRRSWG